MSNILIVLPFSHDTAARAEKLIDVIFQLNGAKASGHVLLVSSGTPTMEQKTKISISATLAFNSRELLSVGEKQSFPEIARHIKENYKSPFLLIDPFNVPLCREWLDKIESEYNSQPKRYMGAHLKDGSENLWLSRTAIYPNNVDEIFMESLGSLELISRSTKTRLIQHLNYEGKQHLDKIREDAVLLCSDRTGTLWEHILEKNSETDKTHKNGKSRSRVPTS